MISYTFHYYLASVAIQRSDDLELSLWDELMLFIPLEGMEKIIDFAKEKLDAHFYDLVIYLRDQLLKPFSFVHLICFSSIL